ncbi:MAG: hypothetical protein GY861_22600 [bacterium]|nr:hypothetical protein [bacterium]
MENLRRNRVVIVSAVKLTEEDSIKLGAFAKLCETKIETIASDLLKEFIDMYVDLELIPKPKESEFKTVVKSYANKKNL